MAHSYALIKAENKALQAANKVKKRRERKKKRRIQYSYPQAKRPNKRNVPSKNRTFQKFITYKRHI
jgi:hypothetical protein